METYLAAHEKVSDPGVVMGYYEAKDVPTYDFLARNFCVCDKWFTSLPLGTQANRLMAMSGESLVLDNVTRLPDQKLVYDWLEEKKVPWRVLRVRRVRPVLPVDVQVVLGDPEVAGLWKRAVPALLQVSGNTGSRKRRCHR